MAQYSFSPKIFLDGQKKIKKILPEQRISQPRFEMETSLIQVWGVAATKIFSVIFIKYVSDNKCIFLIKRKPERKRPLLRSRRKWMGNIKLALRLYGLIWAEFICFRIGTSGRPF
jgi:hypothetical protein